MIELYGFPIIQHVLYLTCTYAYYIHREKMIMLRRWPGDHGKRQRTILPPKAQPLPACPPAIKTSNSLNFSNSILFPGNFLSPDDHDQPSTVLCHSSLTTVTTASLTHAIPATPMPGLVTCVDYLQRSAGHSDVPHTTEYMAHHGARGETGTWVLVDQM